MFYEVLMSTKGLYFSLKTNYEYFFQSHDSKESDEKVAEIDEFSDGSNTDVDDIQEDKCDQEHITFFLDMHSWEKIQPIVKFVKRSDNRTASKYRKKWSLPKHEWAGLLREELWKETKKPCSWRFKTVSIQPDQSVICRGTCKECEECIK